MSLSALQRVWRASLQRGSARLVLLALAECAGDDGVSCPSVTTMAGMARVTVRHCRRILAALEASGEVTVLRAGGRERTNRYQVSLPHPTSGSDQEKEGGRHGL